MRRAILWLIAACTLSLFSCSYEKKLNKWCARCPQKDSVHIKDSLDIRFRDSIREVPAKDGPEFVFDFGDCNCDSINAMLAKYQTHPETKKKNGLSGTAKSDGKKFTIACDEDAYKDTLRNAIQERDFYKFEYEQRQIKAPCPEEHRTRFDGFTFWWFWITAGLMILWGLWNYGRKILAFIPR